MNAVLPKISTATNPQKIASEFDASAGLAMMFGVIVVAGCVWRSDLAPPAMLSAILGAIVAGASVFLVRSNRYREALWIFRSKVVVAVIGGLLIYTAHQNLHGAGAFAFGLYAGFWVSVLALRKFVAEQLTFIRIRADLENPEVQGILK